MISLRYFKPVKEYMSEEQIKQARIDLEQKTETQYQKFNLAKIKTIEYLHKKILD